VDREQEAGTGVTDALSQPRAPIVTVNFSADILRRSV